MEDIRNCEGRKKLNHIPTYAEEQLEHAQNKENKCLNDNCNWNNKTGTCSKEEEYNKLKKENEELTERNETQYDSINKLIKEKDNYYSKIIELQQDNEEYKESLYVVAKERDNYKEIAERLGKSTNEYYYNWMESKKETEYEKQQKDMLRTFLENRVDVTKKENKQLKEAIKTLSSLL